MVDVGLCERLRTVIQDCLSKHLHTSAVFFAEKLVSLSGSSPADVFLFAQALFVSQQYRRALLVVRRDDYIELDIRFRHLAAKCLAECGDWEECLSLLGDADADERVPHEDMDSADMTLSMAALCLLRGKACEALDSKARAVHWYRQAVQQDPFCYEALAALLDNHMLTNGEELKLVEALPLAAEDTWLKLLYRCKCKKYNQHDSIGQDLAVLDKSAPVFQPQDHAPVPSTSAASAAAATPATFRTSADRPVNQALMFETPTPPPRQPAGPPSTSPDAEDDMGQGGGHGEGATPRGYDLGDTVDVIACRADWYHHSGDYEACYRLTAALLGRDPYAHAVLPVHLAAAVQLNKKNELFLLGHKLVDEYPKSALTWYAVGCYYMVTRQFLQARRFFGKATQMDPCFAPAWVGFGHAFAAQDESDQAMAAYRSAAALFPGLHTPQLGMGMEYLRMNNLGLAERMYQQARQICPQDPLVYNELGVLAYRHGQYDTAASWLQQALDLLPEGRLTAAWEPTICNLAHAMRKKQQYAEAVRLYERALELCPRQAGTYAALGYTLHLAGSLPEAVIYYHKALGLRPDDAFTTELLTIAIEEDGQRSSQQLDASVPM